MADNVTPSAPETPKAEVQAAVSELETAVDNTPKAEATPEWASHLITSMDSLTQEIRASRSTPEPATTSEVAATPEGESGETAIVVEKQPPPKPKSLREARKGKRKR